MRIYEIAGWACWGLGALGAVGWLIAEAPGAAMITALTGAGTGVLYFGLGEIIAHLAGIRAGLSGASVSETNSDEPQATDGVASPVRTLEQVSADIARMKDEARRA